MSKRKAADNNQVEVETGIYITFCKYNYILCLYVRKINSKIPKICMIGTKKNPRALPKKRREINIEETNKLLLGKY